MHLFVTVKKNSSLSCCTKKIVMVGLISLFVSGRRFTSACGSSSRSSNTIAMATGHSKAIAWIAPKIVRRVPYRRNHNTCTDNPSTCSSFHDFKMKPDVGSPFLYSHALNHHDRIRCHLDRTSRSFLSCSSSNADQKSVASTSATSGARNVTNASTVVSDTIDEKDEKIKVVPKKFVPYPFEYHQELTIKIDNLTNRGLGVGRVQLQIDNEQKQEIQPGNANESQPDNQLNTNNWVVMVPNVIPGEIVLVRVFRNYKSYSDADLIQILSPSPDRIVPTCNLAGECGGCQYQHMNIQTQRHWKTKHVIEALQQYNIDSLLVHPTIGTEHVFHYRTKITPHYQAPGHMPGRRNRKKRKQQQQNQREEQTDQEQGGKMVQAIGFQRQSQRQILDVPYCPIATIPINQKYEQLRNQLLQQEQSPTKLGATLLLRQDNYHLQDLNEDDTRDDRTKNTADVVVTTDHKEYLTTRVHDLKFRYKAGNFFQNNLHILPVMVDHVKRHATKEATTKMTHFLDCYCGSGLFCLSVAKYFDQCVGIEINDQAVQEAKQNAVLNGIYNCDFLCSSADAIFHHFPSSITDANATSGGNASTSSLNVQDFPRHSTVVTIDPPRKGCSEDFLNQLYAYSPQRIVYMSCDPVTQARDASGILANGYELTNVQPFDLFPQTRHIECLMIFEKKLL